MGELLFLLSLVNRNRHFFCESAESETRNMIPNCKNSGLSLKKKKTYRS